jgi:uncharacterized protein
MKNTNTKLTSVTLRASMWATLGRVCLFILCTAALLAFAAPLCSRLPGQWAKLALGVSTSAGTLLLSQLFLRWERLKLDDAGEAPNKWSAIRLTAGFGVGCLLVGVQTLIVAFSGHVLWVYMPVSGLAPIALSLGAYLALASREELAFRGYPLRRLEWRFGAWVAQLAIALAFALEHKAGGYTWSNALLGAFVGSLLFGIAALSTRGLAVPIGLHAAWNFGQWLLGQSDTAGVWKPIVEAGYQSKVNHLLIIGYLVAFMLAMAAFGLWGKRQSLSKYDEVKG